jgi:hypothetical protein
MRTAVARSPVLLLGAFLLAACSPGAEPGGEPASAPAAAAPAAPPQPVGAAIPAGSHAVNGRTVTVSLPFRAADGLAWVSATDPVRARPFMFTGFEVKPGADPGGGDLAVFTFRAYRAGHAVLEFGLVPEGKVLIGPEDVIYKGDVIKRYTADVTAE